MEKKVYYLFSKNKKIGSRLISWFSGFITKDLTTIPSHVAVLAVDEYGYGLVYESVFSAGVRIVPYKKWKEINEELYCIPCSTLYKENDEINNVVERVWGKPYDWPGILYFTFRAIGLVLFNIPLPKNNRWSSSKKFFCCEFAGQLDSINYSMTTPAKMCSDMLKVIYGYDKI